jgi:hypothetical protein
MCFPLSEQIETSESLSLANHLRQCSIKEDNLGRAVLLWLLGVPIPIIILIALLYH